MEPVNYIPFNRPFLTGKERENIDRVLSGRRFSGNGPATAWCEQFFQQRYGFKRALLTPSCTDALELAALLLDLQPGDEVIIPSFTFASTANAFELHGATLRFADSEADHPNISVGSIGKLIGPKTRALVIVHYAGVACDMQAITAIVKKHNIVLIEDAAHAIESEVNGQRLGTFGALATFSFHETKNVHCGEGGLLAINDDQFIRRAEIIREKGTNREAFFRGEVDRYGWVDIGSSFLTNEITAAFLAAQLDALDTIQQTRISRRDRYRKNLAELEGSPIKLPDNRTQTRDNAHLFYLVCDSNATRDALIKHLSGDQIQAVFHYQSLHNSSYFRDRHTNGELPNADRFSGCLVRLPLYNELSDAEVDRISESVLQFFRSRYNK